MGWNSCGFCCKNLYFGANGSFRCDGNLVGFEAAENGGSIWQNWMFKCPNWMFQPANRLWPAKIRMVPSHVFSGFKTIKQFRFGWVSWGIYHDWFDHIKPSRTLEDHLPIMTAILGQRTGLIYELSTVISYIIIITIQLLLLLLQLLLLLLQLLL